MIGQAALAALPESYGPLFDRAAAVFEADERVRAMWLHGANGIPWPSRLEQAVRNYLGEQGVPLPGRAG